MSKYALEVKNVSKSFRLPTEQANGIKQAFVNWTKGVKGYKEQHVLKDISFKVEKGDFFGIVGRNGSGKSTLLKIISQIYTPEKGEVKVNGTLIPFIELGVGFNPELTGRENVYMNGALLGFSREEVSKMYPEIVEFAELEEFMDQKLKNYSSGMQVRLAFSIAIKAQGDILVLDEVLAVGDEAFQRKCNDFFEKIKKDKTKTVILVTHDMSAVERYCDKAIFINKGVVKKIGNPRKIAAEYSKANSISMSKYLKKSDEYPFTVSIEKDSYKYGQKMTVSLGWRNIDGVKNVGVAIFRSNGEYVFGPNTYQEKPKNKDFIKARRINYDVELNLNEGEYFIKVGLMGDSDNNIICFIEEGPHFWVEKNYDLGRWGGIARLKYAWKNEENNR